MANRMYVVTYEIPATTSLDIRKKISEAIKATGNWWHHIEFSWLVVADKTASDIAKEITPHIREVNGTLLVIEVHPSNRQGLLTDRGWKWIRRWANRFQGLPDP